MRIEYKHENEFTPFYQKLKGKSVTVIYDINTRPYAETIKTELSNYVKEILFFRVPR